MIRTLTTGAALATLLAGAAFAETFEVQMLNKGSDGERMVFEPAFIHAAPGDTITVPAGTYDPIVITKPITLVGVGGPVIDGRGEGTVVAVGDGHVKSDGTKLPLTVKAGDKVLFTSYAGEEISVGDDEFLLLRESDILATV